MEPKEPLFIAASASCGAVSAYLNRYCEAQKLGEISRCQLRGLVQDLFSVAGVSLSLCFSDVLCPHDLVECD